MSNNQTIVYDYLGSCSDEHNLITNAFEIEEYFECVPEQVANAYQNMSRMEFVEVIYQLIKGYLIEDGKEQHIW
jgi:hypothetical protein